MNNKQIKNKKTGQGPVFCLGGDYCINAHI